MLEPVEDHLATGVQLFKSKRADSINHVYHACLGYGAVRPDSVWKPALRQPYQQDIWLISLELSQFALFRLLIAATVGGRRVQDFEM